MRSRGLVVAIAVVLAVLAAVGVIVYTNSVKNGGGAKTTDVIVSNQDIPANSPLNPLLDQGVFGTVSVPNDTLVVGAVTSENELRDQTTSATIYANEQIPTSRLATGTGNALGISEGHVGIGISLDGPNSVNGYIQNNDQVVLYATYPKGTVVTKQTLKQVLAPAQFQRFLNAVVGTSTGPTGTLVMPVDFTTTLVKSVRVLAVNNPAVDSTTGKPGTGSATLVLDMLPDDAQTLVLANSTATQIWLGLLPPNKDNTPATGYSEPGTFGVPLAKVTGVNGQ
jgi:Flp pilus assembly protein CpaB